MRVGAGLYMCNVVKKVHVRYLISWWVLVWLSTYGVHIVATREYDWTVRVRRRCGLTSNYSDHLLLLHWAGITGAVGAVVVQSESMVTAAREAADGVSTPTVHTQRRKQPALVDICRTYVRSKYTSLFTKQIAKITKQTSTVILKNKENLTMQELN